jgi:hypothetical protein
VNAGRLTVPAAPIAEELLSAVRRGATWDMLAHRSGLAPRRLYAILHQTVVTVDVADRVITKALKDPGLWYTRPELAAWA